MRLGLIAALIAPPSYILAANQEQDLVKFIITGAACIAAAFTGGHFLANRAPIPVMPNIRGPGGGGASALERTGGRPEWRQL